MELVALSPEHDSVPVSLSLDNGSTFYARAREHWLVPNLEAGDYDVVAISGPFRDWSQTVTVPANETVSVSAQLVYRAGDIAVSSDPAGAAIWIYDGTPGRADSDYHDTGDLTPATLENVRTGNYVVLLKKDTYNDTSAFASVQDEGVSVVSLVLPPKPGFLGISSDPSGAGVWLDGIDLTMVTPVFLDRVAAGEHGLRLVYPMHHDWVSAITVPRDDTLRVSADLSENLTVLVVDSDPEGARIFFDGVDRQVSTPAVFDDATPGQLLLGIRQFGYRDWEESILVAADDTTRVTARLERLFGAIAVSSTPSGASIWLDDSNTGSVTPAVLPDVGLGSHTVRVTLAGLSPDSQSVFLETEGQVVDVDFTLTLQCPGDNIIGDAALPPEIAITDAQAGGIRGTVNNVDLSDDLRVVLWAKTDHWYVQPFTNSPWTVICGDGTWTNGTHPWDRMVAVLADAAVYEAVPVRYLHPSLFPGVLAWTESPAARTIDFGGYTWLVKVSDTYRVDPGPNFFSDDPADIWKDTSGRVHMTTANHDGKWWATEMVLEDHLGYGQYQFTVDSRVDALDPRAVFAGFVYESLAEELDIEFSQYLASPNNAQYVSQPFTTPGNIVRFDVGADAVTTHRIDWRAGAVRFESWRGDSIEPTAQTLIFSWVYSGPDIPTPDNERMRFNLWLFGGTPQSGQEDEVVIRSFTYRP